MEQFVKLLRQCLSRLWDREESHYWTIQGSRARVIIRTLEIMYLIAEQVQGYLVKLSAIACRTKFIICWNFASKTSLVVEISNIMLVPSNVFFFSVKHKWPRIIKEFDHMSQTWSQIWKIEQMHHYGIFLWHTQRHIWKWYIPITQKLDPCVLVATVVHSKVHKIDRHVSCLFHFL